MCGGVGEVWQKEEEKEEEKVVKRMVKEGRRVRRDE